MTAYPDPSFCARLLSGIHRELDRQLPNAERIDLAGGYLTLDRERQSDYPSTNQNRVQFLGCVREPEAAELDGIAARFRAADVSKWFLWLSPCPSESKIRAWIARSGLSPFRGTGYPTLIHTGRKLPRHDTRLRVEEVGKEALRDVREDLRAIYGVSVESYIDSCGKPGFRHYLAFDGQRPVSAGVLYVDGAIGYLMLAATREADRSRGGQSALIVERVNRALDLGCDYVFAETLYMLKTSLANLRRKGFEIVYDKALYSSWKIDRRP